MATIREETQALIERLEQGAIKAGISIIPIAKELLKQHPLLANDVAKAELNSAVYPQHPYLAQWGAAFSGIDNSVRPQPSTDDVSNYQLQNQPALRPAPSSAPRLMR